MSSTDAILPAHPRKAVYLVAGLISLALGAAHVAYSSVKAADPSWLVVSSAVWAFIVAAPLTMALLNVTASDPILSLTADTSNEPAIPTTDPTGAADVVTADVEQDEGELAQTATPARAAADGDSAVA